MNIGSNKEIKLGDLFIFITILAIGIVANWLPYNFSLLVLDQKISSISPNAIKFYAASISIVLLFPFFKNLCYNDRPIEFNPSISQLFLFLLFLLLIFSGLWATDLNMYLRKAFWLIFGFVVFIYISRRYSDQSFIDNFLLFIALSIFFVTLIGISQNLYDFPNTSLLGAAVENASTFGNKNVASHFVVICFPLLFNVFTRKIKVSQYRLAFFSLVIILSLFYIFYANSKAAMLAITLQFLLLVIFSLYLFFKNLKKNNLKFFRFSYLFVFVLILISLDITNSNGKLLNFSNIIQQNIGDVTSKMNSSSPDFHVQFDDSLVSPHYKRAPRYQIWDLTLRAIENSPIYGNGLGSFFSSAQRDATLVSVSRAHNDLLELVSEVGLIGLFLFIVFFIALLRDFYILLKNLDNSFFYLTIFLSLAGVFISMMVSFPFQTFHGLFILFILLSFVTYKSKEFIKINRSYSLSRTYKKPLFFISVLFFIFSVIIQHFWILQRHNFIYNSGTFGYKYNKKAMDENRNYPMNLVDINKNAQYFIDKDSMPTAIDTFSLAFNDINANYARYKIFMYAFYELKNYQIAENVYKHMKKNNLYHRHTFEMGMALAQKNQDIDEANRIFNFYFNYYEKKFKFKPNIHFLIYLHRWSISTSNYDLTPKLYKPLESLDIASTEKWMSAYYAYIGDYEKSAHHIKKQFEARTNDFDPIVLKALYERGLLTKEEMLINDIRVLIKRSNWLGIQERLKNAIAENINFDKSEAVRLLRTDINEKTLERLKSNEDYKKLIIYLESIGLNVN